MNRILHQDPGTHHTPLPFGKQLTDTLSFDEWLAIGEEIMEKDRVVAFQIGDWINFGKSRFGEKYKAAVEYTGCPDKTLKNYACIARKVAPSQREPRLGIEHHAVVAKLKPHEQKRWLQLAIDEKLSVRRLRASIRKGKLVSDEEMRRMATDLPQINHLALINRLNRHLRQQMSKLPVEKWDSGRRSRLKMDFKPLLEIYRIL